MIKKKIITRILLIFIISFAYSGTSRSADHIFGLDVSLGYPAGVGVAYKIDCGRVGFNVPKIQVLNFYNEDIFMQYMAGIDVRIGWYTYIGVRGGYWHFASYPFGDFFSFSYGGFCLEPELKFNITHQFDMAITYNYLAYYNKEGVFRGSVRAYPALKLGFNF